MKALNRRVVYGAAAAFCATAVAVDSQIGETAGFPGWKLFFGPHWLIAHNMSLGLFTIGAATFGYLAINVKDDPSSG